jgi:hypothetical protein
MRKIAYVSIFLFIIESIQAQNFKNVVNAYGHMNYNLTNNFKESNDPTKSYFELGEHDLFVNSYFKNRISFLGEFVVRYTNASPTNFSASIERARLKFDYYKNHSLLLGKIHTPLNYWNDVYHHGRVFFPTIDRPISFNYIIPLHNLGIQFQGQNLGNLNFGYDLVFGNGISATDAFDENLTPATTFAIHIKPIDNLRLGASYFYDYLSDASISGVHTGHSQSSGHNHGSTYKGSLNFHLVSASAAYFGDKHEFLNEFAYNPTHTDTLGFAQNFSNFTYYGYRIKEKHIPFMIVDLLRIAENDLYTYHFDILKLHLGYRYEFNELLSMKAQLGYSKNLFNEHNDINNLEVKIQFAYGF